MQVFDLPVHILPSSQEWGLKSHTRVFRSAFTSYIQSQETPGAIWTCKYNYPLLTDENMRIFKAWILKLRGQANAFPARDFLFTGGPDVAITASASAGADTCIFSSAVTFKAGDYVNVNSELKAVVEDVTNGTTARIEPPFRSDATNAIVEFEYPACNMVLDSDSVKWNSVSPTLSSLEFSGTEVFVESN